MTDSIYSFDTPQYRSIPDLLDMHESNPEELSFREQHRIRIFNQFEPITEADLHPVESLPLVDRGVQTTPLPSIPQSNVPDTPKLRERSLTWQWPKLRPNDTYRVIKRVRDAQAENTYGFAYYSELAYEELGRSPLAAKPKSNKSVKKPAGARLVPLESASCGLAMEVAKADSKTNWEALMHHINESIRDTQQQRMLGQYMIQKLKREQQMTGIPPEQAAANKRCLENLIERYGTGLEGIVSKEKEFERLIEAYQVFMRGDKKKLQRRIERKTGRRLKLDEPLPAIGDQKAGRSQVGCKIRQELRKEYGEKVRHDLASRSGASRRVIPQTPGAAPKPMQVRVRKSVLVGQEPMQPVGDRASDEVDLPPTPATLREFINQGNDEELEDGDDQESGSQLSLTYVPSDNQSLAQLIPDEGITVEIKQEEAVQEAPEEEEEDLTNEKSAEEEEEAAQVPAKEEEEEELYLDAVDQQPDEEPCLFLQGDSDPDVLVVNSQTELIPSHPSQSPKFEILQSPLPDQEIETTAPIVSEEPASEPTPAAVTEDPTEAKPASPELEDEVSAVPTDSVETPAVETPAAETPAAETPAAETPLKIAAVDLVNGILQKLDSEASDQEAEKELEEVVGRKSIHFKSSPDIVYYEKQSPEEELSCHPDDKLILAEDLTTAESELEEDAKPLYHKVLSNSHAEGEPIPHHRKAREEEEEHDITMIARELTDTVLRKAGSQSSDQGEDQSPSDSAINETARELAQTVIDRATTS